MRPLRNGDLASFYSAVGDGAGLFYVGHASVLCSFAGKRILFDPIVLSRPYGDAWTFFPPQVVDPSFFEVDVVVISHVHQDHYDRHFIKALKARTKVVVLGGRASFIENLRIQGVQNLFIVEPEKVMEILPGVFIFGVLHESNGIDSSTVVFSERFCVYHGNDNYLSADSLRKFIGAGPSIDVACIPYAYVHWYPFLLETTPDEAAAVSAEGDRLIQLYMDDCLSATRILQPKLVIPFGANLLLTHGGAYSPINLSVKSPIEFFDYTCNTAKDLANVVRPMLSGDWCVVDDMGKLEVSMRPSVDAQTYRENAHRFLSGVAPISRALNSRRIDKDEFLKRLNERLSRIDTPEVHFVFVDMHHQDALVKLEIDCQKRFARWVTEFAVHGPYHHFKLDADASFIWLSGGRLEEVIGSRRFTLKRVPNIYSKNILRLASTVF